MADLLGQVAESLWNLVLSCLVREGIPPEARIQVPPIIGLPARIWSAMLRLSGNGEPISIPTISVEVPLTEEDVAVIGRRLDGWAGAAPEWYARQVALNLRKWHRWRLIQALQEDPWNDGLLEELAKLPRGGAATRGLALETRLPEIPPRPDWLVEGLIAKGDLLVLAGEPAAGKSLFAISLALSLAAGDLVPFAAWKGSERPRKVLLIDEEQHPDRALQRILRVARGQQTPLSGIVGETLVWGRPRQGFSFRSKEWVARLHETLADYQPDLLVIDSLRAVRVGSEIDAAATRQFFHTYVYPLISNYGCAVLFLHHTRKTAPGQTRKPGLQDDIAGADLVGAVDTAIMLQDERAAKGEGNHCRLLSWAKLREGAPPDPKVLTMTDRSDGGLTLRLVAPEAVELPSRAEAPRAPVDALQAVLRLLRENGERMSLAAITEATGLDQPRVRLALRELMQIGLVSLSSRRYKAEE